MKSFCAICGEMDLGCNQFGCWKSPARSGASSIVLDSIAKQSAVLEPIPNSQNKPKYSVMQIFEIALMCEVCLVIGFFIGRWLTNGH